MNSCFFFFSSRRRHTRLQGDWSSDVCSSDLHNFHHIFAHDYRNGVRWWQWDPTKWLIAGLQLFGLTRRLKRTPVFQIQRALLAMQFTRARERLAKTPDAGHSHIEQLRARLAHEYDS